MNAGRVEFGADVFMHACGGELERAASGDVVCEGCGAVFTLAEWDEAQRRAATEAGQRHRAVLGSSIPALSGRLGTAAERN